MDGVVRSPIKTEKKRKYVINVTATIEPLKSK